MFTLVFGENKSGKSEFAEQYVMKLPGERVYLATMIPCDEDGLQRIERHRAMREGRGFITIECPLDVGSAGIPEGSNVLLEDLCNLVANEIFEPDGRGEAAVKEGIESLLEAAGNLTVVSNIFEDFGEMSEETRNYIDCLYRLNDSLTREADAVIRVAGGKAEYLKGSI